MLDEMGVIRPVLRKALESLRGIPTDIEPVFVTAEELAPTKPAPPQPIKSRSHRGRRN
jgi:hypothetical protein